MFDGILLNWKHNLETIVTILNHHLNDKIVFQDIQTLCCMIYDIVKNINLMLLNDLKLKQQTFHNN